jgi:hypothetical protein
MVLAVFAKSVPADGSTRARARGLAAVVRTRRVILANLAESVAADRDASARAGGLAAVARAG